jgi:hypothetical protein
MSAATSALCLRTPAISRSEKPASGRTLETRGDAVHHDSESNDVGLFPTKTWTGSVSASAALTSTDYAVTLDRLRNLINDEDEEDRPSQGAYDRAVHLLRDAARRIGMQFPSAIVATGPARSVRLLWSGNDKELRVVIGGSATNRSYIYWRLTGNSGVDEIVEGNRFAEYLNWIVRDV